MMKPGWTGLYEMKSAGMMGDDGIEYTVLSTKGGFGRRVSRDFLNNVSSKGSCALID